MECGGSLTDARVRGHTATLLSNGKVLVVGGAAGQAVGPSDDVVAGTPHYEIYDENCKDGSFFRLFGAGGHRTTDFAGPRDKVKNDMASYHPWEQVWYGTTDPRPQCIEQTETSVTHDGWAYYIYSWDSGLLAIHDQPGCGPTTC